MQLACKRVEKYSKSVLAKMDEASWEKNPPLLLNIQHGWDKNGDGERRMSPSLLHIPLRDGEVDSLPLWKHYSLTAPWQEFITAQPVVEIFSAKCQHM